MRGTTWGILCEWQYTTKKQAQQESETASTREQQSKKAAQGLFKWLSGARLSEANAE
jgi:hypothetical protein